MYAPMRDFYFTQITKSLTAPKQCPQEEWCYHPNRKNKELSLFFRTSLNSLNTEFADSLGKLTETEDHH